ncbi:MAG: hypothetical protein O2910_01235 [Proteobacteria bacterium]|jgi:hypothetical protein|nr:hypothetical protein [Pseudomonadota bacterium]
MARFVMTLIALVVFTIYTIQVLAGENLLTYIFALRLESWGAQVLIDLVIACSLALTWIWHDVKKQGWGGIMFYPFPAMTVGLGSIGLLTYFTIRNYRLMKQA